MWRAGSAVARTTYRDQAPNEMAQCAFRSLRPTGLVLLVADLLHPRDRTAVQRLLNGDMRHRGRRRSAVPVLLAGRKPDDIAGPDFLDGSTPTLRRAQAGGDDQYLAEWMRVPRGAGAGLERDARATNTCGLRRLEQRVHTDRAGEIVRRSLAGGP